jgi:subtilisin family serine protease
VKKHVLAGVFAAVFAVGCGGPAEFPEPVGFLDVDSLDSSLIAGGVIDGHYIVTLRDGADPAEVAGAHGLRPTFAYRTALNGFAGWIAPGQLSRLQSDPDVLRIEKDGVASITQTIPWGIGTGSGVSATISSVQAGNGSGTVTGPTVFVIDTGIASHADLNKVGHVNYAGGKNDDCHGHGTHVAGTVGARDNSTDVVGVAPGVAVFGVKVLSCSGSGSWSGIISGMDFVSGHSASAKVANMSLGGSKNQSVNDGAARMVANNVAVAVAAGNSGADAKDFSPASEPSVLTVAAHDSAGVNASWSNFGTIVDLSAPGVSVLSTARGGGTTTMSGTSMASPHVAGALALYRANNPSASATTAQNAVVANTSGTSSRGFGKAYVGNW